MPRYPSGCGPCCNASASQEKGNQPTRTPDRQNVEERLGRGFSKLACFEAGWEGRLTPGLDIFRRTKPTKRGPGVRIRVWFFGCPGPNINYGLPRSKISPGIQNAHQAPLALWNGHGLSANTSLDGAAIKKTEHPSKVWWGSFKTHNQ